ncbi:MAG: class I SAM-dependent methyltransferase, partial [Anaerolineae bacterium]
MVRIIRLLLNTLAYGPLYGLAQYRMASTAPLDPVENWCFWTRFRHPWIELAMRVYPPMFARRRFVEPFLAQDHAVGIEAHYDVSTDFYRLFLDREFIFYSCADFLSEEDTLKDAQRNKARFLLNLIEPKAGERILELGCGWGSMLKYICGFTGDKDNLSGYTLAKEQVAYIRSELGFNVSLTDFITVSYPESYYD